MSEQRWLQIESIVLEAAERPAADRQTFIDQACAGDEQLRQEVESLLRFEHGAQEFLQRSAMDTAAQLATGDVALDPARLQIDGYAIGEFLGAGGMGEVYAATDTRLDRNVALKIIRSAPDDPAATTRFEEEARSASRLNHPNIVTVHAVGSQGDVSYIVMELVSGQTLRDRMAAGPLPLTTTLDIAAQLAEGLAVAHDMAVVHRDLKPENVMVTSAGLVKILDFGIARRDRDIAADAPLATSAHQVRPFAASSLAGTAGYMSPEQAARGTLDHRSDQYSFGAILFEMFTGRRISERDSATAAPEWRTPIEVSLGAVIDRCLSANPDDRYGSTRDLALAVRQIREKTLHAGPRRFTRRQIIAAGAVAATAVAAVWWWRPFGGVVKRRLLVLPFANMSGDTNTGILADGITAMLIDQLTPSHNLSVIGSDTSFHLAGINPMDVRRQLDVDEVLTGSLTIRGDRAVVDVELVDARTGSVIWSDGNLSRPRLDVLAIQNEIAAAIITRGLPSEASDATLRDLSRGLTSNPAAYRLFLEAVHHFRLDKESDYATARQLLTEAVQADATFALAHLTLASTYSAAAIDGFERPKQAWERSHAYVDRALEQDPDLPDAHAERAIELFFYKRDWAGAQREWDTALQSARGDVQAELLSAYVLQQWALGRYEEALRYARAGSSADPLSPYLAVREADMLAAVGEVSSAIKRYMTIIDSAPDDAHNAYLGLAQLQRAHGRFDDAIESWRNALAETEDEALTTILASAHGEDGCRAIDRYMAKLEIADCSERASSGQYVSPLGLARAHARLDEPEEAFTFLNDAFADAAAGLVFLNVDPAWDNIRPDRRFHDAVRRVGLPQTGQRG